VDTNGFERAFAQFESSIASPDLKEIAHYWRQICSADALPSWSDIRPAAIKTQLRIIWCYDYDPALDDFVGRGRVGLHPQLVHFLERRSYAKALMFLGGETDIPAGACGGRGK